MEYRLFPQPNDGICTPFVKNRNKNCYSRFITWNSITKPISIHIRRGSICVDSMELNNIDIIGKRKIDREYLLDYCTFNKCRPTFYEFVEHNYVIPTFCPTIEEAFIKTIIRQIIAARQAKLLFSNFIKSFGYSNNGLFGFPTLYQLSQLTFTNYRSIGFGFRADIASRGVERLLVKRDIESIFSLKGVGPWSRAIMTVEINRDYSSYPFWDLSVEKIKRVCNLNIKKIAKQDKQLAGDLYVYAASFLESTT